MVSNGDRKGAVRAVSDPELEIGESVDFQTVDSSNAADAGSGSKFRANDKDAEALQRSLNQGQYPKRFEVTVKDESYYSIKRLDDVDEASDDDD